MRYAGSLALAAFMLVGVGAASAAGPAKNPNSPLTWTQLADPPDQLPITEFEVLVCSSKPGCTATPEARVVKVGLAGSSGTGIRTLSIKAGVIGPLVAGQYYFCVRAVNEAGSGACSVERPFQAVGRVPMAPVDPK